MTTRDARISRISRNTDWRTSGELAKSMSPETSKIVVLSCRLAEICTVSSPSRSVAGPRQILHETQLVRRPLACKLHGVHSLADPVQSQSAGPYLLEWPPSYLCQVDCRTLVTNQYF